MDLGLAEKRVVITGGSKGIGLAIAKHFVEEGATVTLVARDAAALADAKAQIDGSGKTVDVVAADLGTDAGRQMLFEMCPDPDILVNNAGAIKGGGIADLSMQDWREGWELKVFGYIHLCKLYIDGMAKRESGTIINIIGMGGRHTIPGYICGAAGNAALIGFTQALGAETPGYNVRVFGINPSPTITGRMVSLLQSRAERELGDADRWQELIDDTKLPFGRMKQPDEVASLAVMLASERVHYLSGTVVDMDGGGRWKR